MLTTYGRNEKQILQHNPKGNNAIGFCLDKPRLKNGKKIN